MSFLDVDSLKASLLLVNSEYLSTTVGGLLSKYTVMKYPNLSPKP